MSRRLARATPVRGELLGRRSLWRVVAWLVLALGVAACGGVNPGTAGPEPTACAADAAGSTVVRPIPQRAPPAAVTTGEVPHRQIDPEINPLAIAELHGRVLELADVELDQSANVVDATEIRVRRGVNVERPECLVGNRAVAHIHPDGSLHGVLPHDRIPEAEAAGWIERHPWAGVRPGFEAYVLIFSPRSSEEVDVVLDLVLEGLRFVSGG